jgi:hypothetical protein
MLPDLTLPASLLAVLENLRGSFTAPTFATFAAMVTGLIAQTGKGTVTGMLTGAGLARAWSHDRAHAFFSRASWNAETLGIVLAHLIVRILLPAGAAVTVAVDDTLFKRRGKKVFGAAWQHDGAATGEKQVGRGTCFVVVGIIVELPFLTRPVCLPVIARLWRPKTGPSKVELAASMIRLLQVCLNRTVHVVADAAYHGRALRHLRASIIPAPGGSHLRHDHERVAGATRPADRIEGHPGGPRSNGRLLARGVLPSTNSTPTGSSAAPSPNSTASATKSNSPWPPNPPRPHPVRAQARPRHGSRADTPRALQHQPTSISSQRVLGADVMAVGGRVRSWRGARRVVRAGTACDAVGY